MQLWKERCAACVASMMATKQTTSKPPRALQPQTWPPLAVPGRKAQLGVSISTECTQRLSSQLSGRSWRIYVREVMISKILWFILLLLITSFDFHWCVIKPISLCVSSSLSLSLSLSLSHLKNNCHSYNTCK